MARSFCEDIIVIIDVDARVFKRSKGVYPWRNGCWLFFHKVSGWGLDIAAKPQLRCGMTESRMCIAFVFEPCILAVELFAAVASPTNIHLGMCAIVLMTHMPR